MAFWGSFSPLPLGTAALTTTAKAGDASVSVTSTVSAVSRKEALSGSVSLPNTATAEVTGLKNAIGTASVTETSGVSGVGQKGGVADITVSVSVTGPSVTGEAFIDVDKEGTAEVTESSAVTASASKATAGSASVSESVSTTVQGTKAITSTGTVACTSAVASTGQCGFQGTAFVSVATTLNISGMRTYYLKRYPNVILSVSHLSGAYTDIDEDPDNPDGSWLLFAA